MTLGEGTESKNLAGFTYPHNDGHHLSDRLDFKSILRISVSNHAAGDRGASDGRDMLKLRVIHFSRTIRLI